MEIKDKELGRELGIPLLSRPGKSSMLTVAKLWNFGRSKSEKRNKKGSPFLEDAQIPLTVMHERKIGELNKKRAKSLPLGRKKRSYTTEPSKIPVVGQYSPNFNAVEHHNFEPFVSTQDILATDRMSLYTRSLSQSSSPKKSLSVCKRIFRVLERDTEAFRKSASSTSFPRKPPVNQPNFSKTQSNFLNHRHYSQSQFSYKFKLQFAEHHIVGENDLHCEPVKIPEHLARHLQSVDFQKSPQRKPFVGSSAHDKRFDNIEQFPIALSRTKYTGKLDLGKLSPRKPLFHIEHLPFNYNPHMKVTHEKISYSTKFNETTGRLNRNSIYQQDPAPEVFDYDKVLRAYSLLGHLKKKPTGFVMKLMTERDDRMYETVGNYPRKDPLRLVRKRESNPP